MSQDPLDRRRFLQGAAGTAALIAGISCSGQSLPQGDPVFQQAFDKVLNLLDDAARQLETGLSAAKKQPYSERELQNWQTSINSIKEDIANAKYFFERNAYKSSESSVQGALIGVQNFLRVGGPPIELYGPLKTAESDLSSAQNQIALVETRAQSQGQASLRSGSTSRGV